MNACSTSYRKRNCFRVREYCCWLYLLLCAQSLVWRNGYLLHKLSQAKQFPRLRILLLVVPFCVRPVSRGIWCLPIVPIITSETVSGSEYAAAGPTILVMPSIWGNVLSTCTIYHKRNCFLASDYCCWSYHLLCVQSLGEHNVYLYKLPKATRFLGNPPAMLKKKFEVAFGY